jgi:large subunit ribosomal protein L6
MVPPPQVSVSLDGPTTIIISGIELDVVGEFAAKIRSVRPPEPYKGKGIAYEGEIIRRKAGKTGK